MRTLATLFIVFFSFSSIDAQVGIGTTTPDASAILEVKSSDKGLLLPRIDDVDDISSPVEGLLVYDLNAKCMRYFNGSVWSACMGETFSCGDVLIDTRDGKSYNTVQIGTQCWMAENLNIGSLVDVSINQTDNSTIEKYCYYGSSSYCNMFGGIYQWNEMMQYQTTEASQGICPDGWHLPTEAEWCTLENFVDAGSVSCSTIGLRGSDVGGNLKEIGLSHWGSPNTDATNSSGFTGLGGGHRFSWGEFNGIFNYAFFWSSNENGALAWIRGIDKSNAQVYRSDLGKEYGCYVRCVKD